MPPDKLAAKKWTREEVILAIDLYCRIPFGRQHSRAPEVIELATALGRTPSSIAMKLNNLTSIDPQEAGRVKGLSGASALDRKVWEEFEADWTSMATLSRRLWKERVEGMAQEQGEVTLSEEPALEADKFALVRVRLAQDFFRRSVLSAYTGRCCVTGLAYPALLEASHIVPWSESPRDRANPRNGLCLNPLHHRAFDLGLITFDEDYRLVVSKEAPDGQQNESFVRTSFRALHGKPLVLPERFRPEERFLAWHRESRFCK